MIRRFGPAPRDAASYLRRPGAYALILHRGRVMLTRQDDPDSEWQLPGGGIDPGESPLAALHREVLEETGWRVRVTGHVLTFRRFARIEIYDMDAEKICHVFAARPAYRLGPPSEPNHLTRWLPVPKALRIMSNPGDAAALRQVWRKGRSR
ncbi:NUDIX domain-containing protein [Palleronia caenipelagi]|uniref:NUDIX hydrolase n=1 Tax=Palleronia caenipelagi TaxID=2489174 RepID=A0A547Q2H7_9RHOB|nr:NUDIX hydrolase [Palleronia caenipelagi]TRD20585.1 NUDIX hydrolase [Palleronia caenipelagi]